MSPISLFSKNRTPDTQTYTHIQTYISEKCYAIILLALQITYILDMLNNYKLSNEKQDIIIFLITYHKIDKFLSCF